MKKSVKCQLIDAFDKEIEELEEIMRKGAVVRNEFLDVAMMARVKED